MDRLSLSNEFLEGKNNVYCFGGATPVLVDTGFDAAEVRDQLEQGVAASGLEFADVDAIVLTHYHIDHCGLAAELQRESGATVYAHPDDRPLVEGDEAAWAAVIERRRRKYDEWGIPPAKQTELEDTMIEEAGIYDRDISVTPIEEGDEIDAGDGTLEVLHTPGHTKGHVALAMPDRNDVLSGDALLPVYTPNVGGADVRLERPLERYLRTLERFATASFDRAWPGHRHPIDDPASRARAVIEHHEERAWRVVSLLAEHGALSAWEVSRHLFGELEGIHVLHGPGESFAHLDHLDRTGAVEWVDGTYRLTDDGAARLDSRSGEAWPLP